MVDSGSTCATSSLHASRFAERVRAADRRRADVVADHCDPDRAGVEPFGVRADHVLVDAAVAALEHLPVLVDEKVVADVVPAVALHVVDLDPAHDRRRLRGACTNWFPPCDERPRTARSARSSAARGGSPRSPPSVSRESSGGEPASATRRKRNAHLRAAYEVRAQTVRPGRAAGTRSGRMDRSSTGCRDASRASPGASGVPASGRSSASGAAAARRSTVPRACASGTAPCPCRANAVRRGRTRASPQRACGHRAAARHASSATLPQSRPQVR